MFKSYGLLLLLLLLFYVVYPGYLAKHGLELLILLPLPLNVGITDGHHSAWFIWIGNKFKV